MLILPGEPYLPSEEPWLRHQHVIPRTPLAADPGRLRAVLAAVLAVLAIVALFVVAGVAR
jgi:hypothetical protein